MRKDSLFQRYEVFAAAAVITAHANSAAEGFRQRDVRFYIELFSNWIELGLETSALDLSNTQVSRYVEELADEGLAKRSSRKGKPWYRLTRAGVVDLVSRLVNRDSFMEPPHFLFVHYFIRNYRELILSLLKLEGKPFPKALRIEIENLLEVRSFVKIQLAFAEKEEKKIDDRIKDSLRTNKLASRRFAAGDELLEVTREVESRFPYELNSRKPLTELISQVPPELARWELQVGNMNRIEQIWKPTRLLLLSYIRHLRHLAKSRA